MSEKDPETDYAFWIVPGTAFKITYSLGVFHEIDFQVNEGYRRIPHGGIEVGGLLFGRGDETGARIEAFRPIECEHASGPSFVLSERDVAGIREQIAAAASDPDLQEFQLLGWFIAHTRSPLKMSDREAVLFDELIPGAGKITLLIKPERFQPTRFGFLVRREDGTVERDATERAIILPLPGRAGGRASDGPVPSIAAPTEKPASAPTDSPVASPVTPPEPAPLPPLVETPQPAVGRAADPIAPDLEREFLLARTEVALPVRKPSPGPEVPASPAQVAHTTLEETRKRRPEIPVATGIPEEATSRHQATRKIQPDAKGSNARLAIVLFFAAALGCAVGYLAYLQMPSPLIALAAESQHSGIIVSWPPEQTRDAVYAAIRIDDGQQIPLSAEQKAAGQAKINVSGENIKVELIAQHWMRDSRGIIRFIAPAPPAPAPAPAVSPPQQ